MRFTEVYIPVGGAWSSPFCRWQGGLSAVSSLELAVDVTRRALRERSVAAGDLTDVVLGWTVPQPEGFYGAPTLAARIGAPAVSGPMVAQACATSAASVAIAATSVQAQRASLTLVVLTDRTSNGPHLVWPSPGSPGGAPRSEDWVLENFRRDPWAGEAMVATAEAVAREGSFTREQIDEVTMLRHEQYSRSLDDGRAFQRRYMVAAQVPGRTQETIEQDAGIHPTTREGLRELSPVIEGGLITFGSQTHPADGAAGVLVTNAERARRVARDGAVAQLLAFGSARVEQARMPKAPVPAARRAMSDAGIRFEQLDVVMTHNPFAVNDLWLSKETGIPLDRMNPFGCSLVYGHPQGPTGARALAELIEALALRGGGIGLFTGCAAGDTGAALVVRVDG
ncbi:MAG: thiolase family protein [Actinomycetota bacterium]|nr:thiolase family protein [Actinomycetota bacterium]